MYRHLMIWNFSIFSENGYGMSFFVVLAAGSGSTTMEKAKASSETNQINLIKYKSLCSAYIIGS